MINLDLWLIYAIHFWLRFIIVCKIYKMTEYSYEKYPFLKELGIEKENLGAYYNGKWQSSGSEILKSINPAT